MSQVKQLIDAMSAGKSLDIEASFNEIMATKMVTALDTRREAIASNLFASVQEETVDEAVDHNAMAREVSDKIDKIVKSGGQVSLKDPLSIALNKHRAAAKKMATQKKA